MSNNLKSVIGNTVLLAFLYIGNLGAMPSIAIVATIILWVAVITTMAVAIFLKTDDALAIIEATANQYEPLNRFVSTISSIAIAGSLLYLGYPVLTIAYLLAVWVSLDTHNTLISNKTN